MKYCLLPWRTVRDNYDFYSDRRSEIVSDKIRNFLFSLLKIYDCENNLYAKYIAVKPKSIVAM